MGAKFQGDNKFTKSISKALSVPHEVLWMHILRESLQGSQAEKVTAIW